MRPADFEGVNAILRCPPGSTDCEDLPIERGIQPDGSPIVASVWEPASPEEERLLGGRIRLTAWHVTHPPIRLDVVVDPESEHFAGGRWHRRVVELLGLLTDSIKVQRSPCDHAGIGLPGCVTCDPRIRDAVGIGQQAQEVES